MVFINRYERRHSQCSAPVNASHKKPGALAGSVVMNQRSARITCPCILHGPAHHYPAHAGVRLDEVGQLLDMAFQHPHNVATKKAQQANGAALVKGAQ
jgi:hypothetical protein